MNRIGIMGGTFNPIHNGHLMLAKNALEQFALTEVIFMPCGVPYMKSDQEIAPGQARAEMTALAIQDNPRFKLSTIEIEQQGNTYTYKTLERLRKENPDADYFFILGADSLFHITKWAYPERIFSNCHILAAVRDDKTKADMEEQIRLLFREYHADIALLETAPMDISSSDIRRKIAAGATAVEVPAPVRAYIEQKGLYR